MRVVAIIDLKVLKDITAKNDKVKYIRKNHKSIVETVRFLHMF